jgi:ABC-type molybdate transport system permease subunit
MSSTNRWQDWTTIAAGVVLFITPFLFNQMAIANAAYTALVGGVLLVLVGVWNLARSSDRAGEWLEGLIGVLLILAPFVLGFAAVTTMAFSAWIIGIISVLLAASVLFMDTRDRPAMAAQH